MRAETVTRSPCWKALEAVATRFASMEARKTGAIQFQLTGQEGGQFALEVDQQRRVKQIAGMSPLKQKILVTGNGKQVRMVLEGKRSAAKAFLAGGVQVRGDIRYLESVLRELKLLKAAK
jgi:hypothetical protein